MKKLKKGGTPSPAMAAKFVVKQWTAGKIRFFTRAPLAGEPGLDHIAPEHVVDHAKDFR
jgi:hypothetical protein